MRLSQQQSEKIKVLFVVTTLLQTIALFEVSIHCQVCGSRFDTLPTKKPRSSKTSGSIDTMVGRHSVFDHIRLSDSLAEQLLELLVEMVTSEISRYDTTGLRVEEKVFGNTGNVTSSRRFRICAKAKVNPGQVLFSRR